MDAPRIKQRKPDHGSNGLAVLSARNVAKRKIRERKTAEIFTPPELMEQMTDKFEEFNPDFFCDATKTVCDPACGNGNMLIEVLKRKLAKGSDPLEALSTIYGVDIMKDNIKECRLRLLQVLRDAGIEVNESHKAAVRKNIKWLDTKKYPNGALDYDFGF